jgi:hypothetical protein
MHDGLRFIVFLTCSLLICTVGIVSGSALTGNPDNVSSDGGVWIDGIPSVSGMSAEQDEPYTATETQTLAKKPEPGDYEIGDTRAFVYRDEDTHETNTVNATCEAVGKYCCIFIEEDQTIPEREAEALADAFDTVIYPTDTEVFGNATDVDGYSRIFILLLDIPDRSIRGFFDPIIGNDTDLIYVNSEVDLRYINETIAHEFQHLIHHRYDPNETHWVNEGCSVYAEFACFGKQQQDRIYSYMIQPDTPLIVADYRFNWADENDAHYGASYLWTLYLSENFGDLSNRSGSESFIRDLVAANGTGIQGIDETLALHRYEERFDDVFKQWVVANYLESEGADPPLGYALIDYSNPPRISGQVNLTELNESTYSFPEQDMHSWSAAYYEVETDDPERITCSNDRGFWNTSFINADGNVIIVISPLNDGGDVILTVSSGLPDIAADFTANVTSGIAPLLVQFTDTSTGNITAWSWDFGDNETSSEQNPVHTYNKTGTYTVSLTVTEASGATGSEIKEGYITVKALRDIITIYESPGMAVS